MFEVFNSLASYGFFGGGSIGNILAQWEAAGVFSYALPFLLIFALIFSVLSSIKLFAQNKGVNAVIALSVALMSLQFDFVSMFFSEIFPRFGIGLAIILVVVIIGGFFWDPDNKTFKWIFVVIGLIVAAVVIFRSLSSYGWQMGGMFFNSSWMDSIWVILIIVGIIAVIASASPKNKFPSPGLIPVYQGQEHH